MTKPTSGKGSGKRAPLFTINDPRSALGGKAKKRNRIGRESALATCRRMNFDPLESLILFAQGNEEHLNMAPGSITGAMRLGAIKETLTYTMTKKQVVTLAPDTGSSDGEGAMQIMVVVPNNSKTPSVLELDNEGQSTITLDLPPLTQEDVDFAQEYDDGILPDDVFAKDGYININ